MEYQRLNDALRQRNPKSSKNSSGVGGAVGSGRIINASSRTRRQQRQHLTLANNCCCGNVRDGITKKADARLRIILTLMIIALTTIGGKLVAHRDKISTNGSEGLRMMSLLRRRQQHQQSKKKSRFISTAPQTIHQSIVCTAHPQLNGLLNDDYCDCPDGSDETLTSACSHLTVGKHTFACNDEDNTMIFASTVGDGIVDCPNGSDEKKWE